MPKIPLTHRHKKSPPKREGFSLFVLDDLDRLGEDHHFVVEVLHDAAFYREDFFAFLVFHLHLAVEQGRDDRGVVLQDLEAAVGAGDGDRAHFAGVDLFIGGDDFEIHFR